MKRKVVVEIRGGTLVGLYTNDRDVEAYVVDWDDIEGGASTHDLRAEMAGLEEMPAGTRKIVGESVGVEERPIR